MTWFDTTLATLSDKAATVHAKAQAEAQSLRESAARLFAETMEQTRQFAEQAVQSISQGVGNSLDATLGDSGLSSVQGCPYAQGACGVNSDRCKAAQADPEVQHILSRVKTMRTAAIALGQHDAVAALDRYLSGEGGFEEIPQDHVAFVRSQHEAAHYKKHTQKTFTNEAIKKEMAARLFPAGATTPVIPDQPVEIDIYTEDGPPKSGGLDRALTYYGSNIRTESKWSCTVGPDGSSFECTHVGAKSYVVDNYDWEGNKQFTFGNVPDSGNAMLWAYVRPGQSEMNRLQEVGCARSYQRSSRSWQAPGIAEPYKASFADDREIMEMARARRMTNAQREADNFDITGALPNPGPAEGHR